MNDAALFLRYAALFLRYSLGGPPILLEPVKATVTIASRPIEAVNILDHDGRRTGRMLALTDGRFALDGAKDQAIYYEVVFRQPDMSLSGFVRPGDPP